MNDIADSKGAVIKAKVDKARAADEAQNGPGVKGTNNQAGGGEAGKKVKTSGDKKRMEKAKALVCLDSPLSGCDKGGRGIGTQRLRQC